MKKFIHTLLFLAIIFIVTPTKVSAGTLIWSDNFNYSGRSGLSSNWSMDNHVGIETFLCGNSGPNCVKLASTQNVPGAGVTAGDGWINNSFTVEPGATYRAQATAGVYANGSAPNGVVKIVMGDGLTSDSNWCTQNTCPALGSRYTTQLYVDFVPKTSRLTVWLEGTQGGCSSNPSGCHDAGVDDFTLTKIADAPTPPPSTTTTNASTCSSISINNGNPIIAGQTYSATVNMRNDGNTTWSSGTNYNLGSQEPQDLTTWGATGTNGSYAGNSNKGTRPNRVTLPRNIGPGDTAPFTFSVTAPDTAGTYRFSYQMVQDGPAGWFGSRCTPNVNVSPSNRTEILTVSCYPNPTTATTTPPQSITWTATAVGGSGNHNYTWVGDEGLSGTGTRTVINGTTPTTHSINKTYTNTGTKAARVKVTSTDGQDTGFVDCSPSVTISQPFNYNISNSGNITVIQGSSRANTITLTKTAGNAQSVSLSSTSTLPSGATKTITPTSCSPDLTCYPSFTVYTTDTTPVGTYPITVTSTSAGLSSKTTNFNLIVNAPVTGGTPPTVNIRANSVEGPIDIAHNAAATLSWVTANNPTSCTGTGSWSGAKSFTSGTTHTQSTGNLTGPNSYTYTIGCENPAGSYSDSVVVNVAGPVGVAACSLSSIPSSGTGPFTPTIRATYSNLTSSPGSITINCGSGTNATASNCTGTSGSCSTTCSYPAVSASTTYNATASIGSVVCSPTTVTNNAPGSTPAPSNCPWIQTTGGDVHSNTKITARCGP